MTSFRSTVATGPEGGHFHRDRQGATRPSPSQGGLSIRGAQPQSQATITVMRKG